MASNGHASLYLNDLNQMHIFRNVNSFLDCISVFLLSGLPLPTIAQKLALVLSVSGNGHQTLLVQELNNV